MEYSMEYERPIEYSIGYRIFYTIFYRILLNIFVRAREVLEQRFDRVISVQNWYVWQWMFILNILL